jgi:hypothetical protein
MNVTAIGGNSINNVTYLVIHKLIAGTRGDYPQAFVLYEDGNIRIIPQSRVPSENATFGTSVIVGATDNNGPRYVVIDSVVIDPLNLSMDVKFRDNTSYHAKMQVNRSKNSVEISNITYDTSNHSFARLRSMWVKDSNADTDHIRTKDGEFPIMGGWKELYGTWWQFFKKVPSIHNTYCPDIRVELYSKREMIYDGTESQHDNIDDVAISSKRLKRLKANIGSKFESGNTEDISERLKANIVSHCSP